MNTKKWWASWCCFVCSLETRCGAHLHSVAAANGWLILGRRIDGINREAGLSFFPRRYAWTVLTNAQLVCVWHRNSIDARPADVVLKVDAARVLGFSAMCRMYDRIHTASAHFVSTHNGVHLLQSCVILYRSRWILKSTTLDSWFFWGGGPARRTLKTLIYTTVRSAKPALTSLHIWVKTNEVDLSMHLKASTPAPQYLQSVAHPNIEVAIRTHLRLPLYEDHLPGEGTCREASDLKALKSVNSAP